MYIIKIQNYTIDIQPDEYHDDNLYNEVVKDNEHFQEYHTHRGGYDLEKVTEHLENNYKFSTLYNKCTRQAKDEILEALHDRDITLQEAKAKNWGLFSEYLLEYEDYIIELARHFGWTLYTLRGYSQSEWMDILIHKNSIYNIEYIEQIYRGDIWHVDIQEDGESVDGCGGMVGDHEDIKADAIGTVCNLLGVDMENLEEDKGFLELESNQESCTVYNIKSI